MKITGNADVFVNGGKLGEVEEITIPVMPHPISLRFDLDEYSDAMLRTMCMALGIPVEMLVTPMPEKCQIEYRNSYGSYMVAIEKYAADNGFKIYKTFTASTPVERMTFRSKISASDLKILLENPSLGEPYETGGIK